MTLNEIKTMDGTQYYCNAFKQSDTEEQNEVAEYFIKDVVDTMITHNDLKFIIKKVIFNDPATIVLWMDGTKTVVKAQDEVFDPEKGLAMAISKKALSNKGNYCNEIKKWTETYPKEVKNKDNFTELSFTVENIETNGEKVSQSYNPVQKAYDMVKDFHHGGKTTDFDEVLGYLGEALGK